MAYLYRHGAPTHYGALGQACALHGRFFGRAPDRVGTARIEAVVPNRVLVELGDLRALVYRSARHGVDGRNYVHFFQHPPKLLADARGKRLYVVGGRYRVTRRGIEG